jgi:hypothetical protein
MTLDLIGWATVRSFAVTIGTRLKSFDARTNFQTGLNSPVEQILVVKKMEGYDKRVHEINKIKSIIIF